MKNKKSSAAFEGLMWTARIIFLVIVIFAINLLIRSYITTTLDISELEANIFAFRMLYSANSFSFFDQSTERVYPGVIDVAKFNDQSAENFLEKSAYYGKENKEVGAKFSLKDLSENSDTVIYYNEDFFKEQKKLVDSGFTKGPGGARGYIKKYDVLIFKNSAFTKGLLTIEVVIPNS